MFVSRKRKIQTKLKRSFDEENDNEHDVNSVVSDMKEIQKLRKKPAGVSAESLNQGNETVVEKTVEFDPFKMKTGGYVDMKALKKMPHDCDTMEQIGTSFAAATNRRDEDKDMLKYVEIELAKHKGIHKEEKEKINRSKSKDDFLYELPEHLKDLGGEKGSEDMLSNQILSGIPEVDLGIESKIKNIEATEDAKNKLLADRLSKKDADVSFVPTNMAANYMQHNRFKIEELNEAPKLRKPEVKASPARVGDVEKNSILLGQQENKKKIVKSNKDKASDDFHYEKFKKHNRR